MALGALELRYHLIKKKDKTPREEIARAWRIYQQDQAQTTLAIVREAKP